MLLAFLQSFSIILTYRLVNLNHFRLLRVVGKGAFGKVRIVERKDSGLTFALKYIRKDEGKCVNTLFLSHIPSREIWRKTLNLPDLLTTYSGSFRKRAKHHPGAADVRASQSPIFMQSALQLSRCRVPLLGRRFDEWW